VRLPDQRFGLVGIAAQQQAALPAGRDRHVAADQERQPAEHLLLGHSRLGSDQLPDPVRKILVVGHRGNYGPLRGILGANYSERT
jgi:hypothetical protein